MGMLATKNKRLMRQHRFLARQLTHRDSVDSSSGLGANEHVGYETTGGSDGVLREIEGLDSLDDEEVCD